MSATGTDCGAHEEPSLQGERHRRRPVTIHRTGRRGKLHALFGTDARTLAESSSEFSTRHTRVRQETGGNPITVLNRLLNTLQESGIPGPQLFRLDKEFSRQLGQGGQGNVRGLDVNVAQQYRQANKRIHRIWPVEHIAIKQHLERKDGRAHKAHFDRENLSSRFRAAECEVLALAPGLFHNHPNIVKLIGWGLCLDTVEDPTSPCCGGLQLPLLVFERADMNLAQFLDDVFTETTHGRSDEARLEEGLAASSLIRPPWSLAGRAWRSVLRKRTSIEDDAYEAVRRLCIDVGHGLQSLHKNSFTHGDLKPENVLVFKSPSGWTAKLCDFGCAVGQDNDTSGTWSEIDGDADAVSKQKQKRHRSTYLGTPGWTPPERELESIQGFDGLRRCDLYVYGLLVWSSFCLGGRPYSRRPRLQDMLEDVMELATSRRNLLVPSTTFERQIVPQITQLLQDTMREPEERSLTPWALLYRRSRWGRANTEKGGQSSRAAADAYSQDSEDFEGHLSLETKASYNDRAWWSRPGGQSQDHTLAHVGDQSESASTEADNDDIEEPGPASLAALSPDDNCLSTALFQTRRRFEDTTNLPSRMISTAKELSPANRSQDGCEELYHLARFRSRIALGWWKLFIKKEKEDNILRMALQAFKPLDTHTLAWLCAGPIGRTEVKGLTAHRWTWESIVRPGLLNESERLDRFLLLLQFGAPVHKTAPIRRQGGRPFEIQEEDRGTIFAQFIKSCRPAILDTVVTQIFRRLGRAREDGLIPDSTFGYFFQQLDGRLWPGRAFLELDPSRVDTAIDGFKAGLSDDAFSRLALAEGPEELEQEEPSQLATETSPLLRPKVLPHGWNVIDNASAKDTSATCYEDGFTHSVTLTRPKVSPLQMRQLRVCFLQQHGDDSLSCHVDLLACMRAGSGAKELGEFAQNLDKRFPYYDDAWFAAEWNTEPNVVDVMQALKEPWGIQTFTSLLDAPVAGGWRAIAEIVAGIGFLGIFSVVLAAMVYLATLLNMEHVLFMSFYTALFVMVIVGFIGIASKFWSGG